LELYNLPLEDIIRIELELTSTCNLECVLCSRETHPEFNESNKFRPLLEITKQLDTYKNLQYVTLAGPTSEPTLYPYLFDLIKYLILRDIEISLFINGDTHNELYYKKLGIIFQKAEGSIYFTICGSTQELHSKYRVNSNLSRVLFNLDIIDKYTSSAVLTWIVFEYNEADFEKNYKQYSAKYCTEYFYTLPVAEHYNIKKDGIHLPNKLSEVYNEINRNDTDITDIKCPALSYKFTLISSSGESNPCNLYKNFGTKHCFECSKKNSELLRRNKIYHLAEPEDEISEIDLRIKDENN